SLRSTPSKPYLTTPSDSTRMPRGIPYIIGNETAERFSFYGMRTILVVFMTRYLHYMVDGEVGVEMSDAEANEYFHNFVAAVYFFPVLGSFLSDIFIGKYRTILWLSIVYCLGHLALALMGNPGLTPTSWLILGLLLISVGSGGIKPCVTAHVGDQFGVNNSNLMSRVYQWFYFAINFGSTFSTMMTPVLLKWYGPHVAFGVPGVLMGLATLMFWKGRHVFVHVPPGGMRFFKETFSPEGISALLKLTIVYAFVTVFWSLFDQTGSSWVLQAENMDRHFLGFNWLESQIQVVNPILVLILIPLFQFLVYPAVNSVFTLTPIRKISIGFFFAAGGYALIASAQRLIDQGQTPSIAWQLWAYLLLTSAEIMISITGIEFSYTQAPKSMKAVVMALWLFFISLGNLFAASVNHYIQVPGISQIAAEVKNSEIGTERKIGSWHIKISSRANQKDAKTVRVCGADGRFDSPDDIVMQFSGRHQLEDVETVENKILKAAAETIEVAFRNSLEDPSQGILPSDEQGQQLLSLMTDSQGQSLAYQLLSKNVFRITSPGADRQGGTQWDVILKAKVSRADTGTHTAGLQKQPYDWLEKRIIASLGTTGEEEVKRARGIIPETTIDSSITVGGQDTLEGAAYFDFWTYTILITAVLFVPVGYFYKEKSYIQTD
ncbi:MAG: POT family MFS transporter, partial [Acidiferrobacterales bacterium]